jgi:hypothetical protein
VSSVLVAGDEVRLYFNLFDCRTCVLSVSMLDLLALVEREDAFVSLDP